MTVAAHGMAEVPWCPREGLAYSRWQQEATLQSAGGSLSRCGLVRALAECGVQIGDLEHVSMSRGLRGGYHQARPEL